MRGYTECYVAFLDILGFKNLIEESDCNTIYDIFQSILDFEPHQLLSKTDVYKKIHHTIMSDSIVVYIDAAITDGFMALTDACSQIQMRLLCNNPPIFIRGGIAKGTLCHENNILFGDGLTKAYILESTSAIYPRIIFTEELKQTALQNTEKLYPFDYSNIYYKKDDDEMYYIDFLCTLNLIRIKEPKKVEEVKHVNNEYFYCLHNHVNDVLNKEIELSIRKKYLWVKNKIKKQIECIPQVKEYFEELQKKEKEAADIRFNKLLNSIEDENKSN